MDAELVSIVRFCDVCGLMHHNGKRVKTRRWGRYVPASKCPGLGFQSITIPLALWEWWQRNPPTYTFHMPDE